MLSDKLITEHSSRFNKIEDCWQLLIQLQVNSQIKKSILNFLMISVIDVKSRLSVNRHH